MIRKLEENQTIEITVPIRALVRAKAPVRSKDGLNGAKYMKRFIAKRFGEKLKVHISQDLNNYFFSFGEKKIPRKVRVRVTKQADKNNVEENVFSLDLVVVGSFAKLQDVLVEE